MSTVATHPGGPFYVWYVSVYGYAPPATVSTNATRYLAWQQGVSKALAATIPYGTIGEPSAFFAGQEAAQQAAQASAAAAAAAAQAQQAAAAAAAQAAQEAAAQQAAAAAAAAAAAQAAAAPAPAPAAPAPAAPTPAAPTPAATSTTATYIETHPGGDFYEWYVSVYGYAPPAQVNTQAARYLAWQQGIPKSEAVLIPYGAIGPPGEYIIGSALLAPTQVTEPGSSTPVTVPAAAQTEAGVAATPTQPAPANLPPEQGSSGASTTSTGPVASTAGGGPLPTQYGIPLTHEQILLCDNVFNIGLDYTHDPIVLGAAYYAMMGESDISFPSNGAGPFQTTCSAGSYDNGQDYQGQARSFFNSGECFARGAVSYREEYDTEWQIANATEENKVWSESRGDSYARDGYTTAMLTAEAKYAVSYFLPGLSSASPSVPPASSGQPSAPVTSPPGTDQAPAGWGSTQASGAVNSGYYQLQKTFSVWNPGFRDQLNTLANRPLEG